MSRVSNVPGQIIPLFIVGNSLPIFCLTLKAFNPRETCRCFFCMMTYQISSSGHDNLIPIYRNQLVLSD